MSAASVSITEDQEQKPKSPRAMAKELIANDPEWAAELAGEILNMVEADDSTESEEEGEAIATGELPMNAPQQQQQQGLPTYMR